jgi:succinyl-diaminopimelate desuccinylase
MLTKETTTGDSIIMLAHSANDIKPKSKELVQIIEHLTQLVHRPSVTPNDAGCQQYLTRVFHKLGMVVDSFEINGVTNLIAKVGHGPIRVAFSGHTDVVPANNPEAWQFEPFSLTESEGKVYGRGVADMKGGIAAMLVAFENNFSQLNMDKYTFYFLITSDEEGEAEYGTKEIVAYLAERNELPHVCIVGEPSSTERSGDVIKIGRRGAISGEITIEGKQGHVAYPQHANNASHKAMALGRWLTELSWDEGSSDFPGSHLQITGIDTGSWTDNIIPGQCKINFNIRYSHKQNEQEIKKRIGDGLLQLRQLTNDIKIEWSRSCLPYYTSGELAQSVSDDKNQPYTLSSAQLSEIEDLDLVAVAEQAVFDVTQRFPRLSTSGGTSDGRFIAATGCQVIELGLPNHSIHQVNEHVALQDLSDLQFLYGHLLTRIAG